MQHQNLVQATHQVKKAIVALLKNIVAVVGKKIIVTQIIQVVQSQTQEYLVQSQVHHQDRAV